jgi:uncharacterized membrane protein
MRAITTERGLDRLVNFSDAAVAIAITLLVLPLVDIAGKIGHLSVGELVAEHWGALLGFVISFAVIGRFWTIHHRVFEWVDSYSRPLLGVNLVWLASIAFIPFTTNVLANAPSDRADVDALYIGTMIVTTAAMVLMEVILQRNPQLVREDSRDKIDLLRASTPMIILVVCLVLVIVLPKVGMWWLLLLLLSGRLHALLARIVRGRAGARGTGSDRG